MKKILFIVNLDKFFVSHRLPIALAAQDAGYRVHIATQFTTEKNSNPIWNNHVELGNCCKISAKRLVSVDESFRNFKRFWRETKRVFSTNKRRE